jgi:hypothetical protein
MVHTFWEFVIDFYLSRPAPEVIGQINLSINDEYYDTTNENRGIALVFNHLNFKSMKSRSGTTKDKEDIVKVLRSMDFDVRVYNDLNKGDLLNILESSEYF